MHQQAIINSLETNERKGKDNSSKKIKQELQKKKPNKSYRIENYNNRNLKRSLLEAFNWKMQITGLKTEQQNLVIRTSQRKYRASGPIVQEQKVQNFYQWNPRKSGAERII